MTSCSFMFCVILKAQGPRILWKFITNRCFQCAIHIFNSIIIYPLYKWYTRWCVIVCKGSSILRSNNSSRSINICITLRWISDHWRDLTHLQYVLCLHYSWIRLQFAVVLCTVLVISDKSSQSTNSIFMKWLIMYMWICYMSMFMFVSVKGRGYLAIHCHAIIWKNHEIYRGIFSIVNFVVYQIWC